MYTIIPQQIPQGMRAEVNEKIDDLSTQVIVMAVHISDFFMKLLHRLDAVCLQKAE